MKFSMAALRRRLMGISLEETTFARRGFRGGSAEVRGRLERIGATFVQGYHAALDDDNPWALARELNTVDLQWRGFAFEGAGMAVTLLDQLTPWKNNRLQALLDGPGSPHTYMVHVGAGWAYARFRRRVSRPLARLDPVLRWLAVDGYGFHEGYFHWRHSIVDQAAPARLTGYAARVFDQGLGRSLWFVEGAEVARVQTTIGAFPQRRRADLWSGVGLACAYAGGVDRSAMEALCLAAEPWQAQLAQGAAFAAAARHRAGNPAPHTDLACEVLCGLPASVAVSITEQAFERLPHDAADPAYETWRVRIQAQCKKEDALAWLPS